MRKFSAVVAFLWLVTLGVSTTQAAITVLPSAITMDEGTTTSFVVSLTTVTQDTTITLAYSSGDVNTTLSDRKSVV